MTSPALQTQPINKIPLIRSEMTALGRFAVIFGQIDFYLTEVLSHLLYVDTRAGYQMMENITTGRKVGTLNKNLFRIKDATAKAAAKKFTKEVGGLVERRNHMFHGMWGWHFTGGKFKPGCNYPKNKDVTIYPEKIAVYANHAAEQSYLIHKVYCILVGMPLPSLNNPNPKFRFADEDDVQSLVPKGIQIKEIGRSYKDHPGRY